MIVRKGFRFRLRPNKTTEALFRRFAGACRWVYNRGLAERNETYEKEGRTVTLFEQNKALTLLKNEEKTSWLKEIHSQVLQQSLDDLNKAFLHFFRRVKCRETPGFPRFKCKGDRESFRFPQGVKLDQDRVFLPKIGWVRFRKSRELRGEINQTTVLLEGGSWYVCFSCEWEENTKEVTAPTNIAGIDLGLESFATLSSSEGIEEIANPRFMKKEISHLKYLGRQLSKKVYKGRNWNKAKLNLQTFWKEIRQKRNDFLHKLSTKIVKNHDMIVVESLKVKALLETGTKALSRAIGDAGWRSFLQFLKYKSEYSGKRFFEVDQFFPSTQKCSRCDKKNPIPLSMRTYNCACGLVIHRDHNAAINLRAAGTAVIKACGAAL